MFPTNKYEEFLEKDIGVPNTKILRDALVKHKAIIAGGSVLSVYANYPIMDSDFDIYIHQKHALEFIQDIAEVITYKSSHTAPAYDMSFFKKNHILSRITGKIKSNVVARYFQRGVDIMVVDNATKLEDVVQNFDLTFCEIWYDPGLNIVKSTEDVGKKHGYLRKEYLDALFKYDNHFIKERIKKYIRRGFEIEVPKMTQPLLLEFDHKKNKKKVSNPEDWAVSHIVKNIYNIIYVQDTSTIEFLIAQFMCSFSKFTVEQLEENITKWIAPSLIGMYNLEEPLPLKAIYVGVVSMFEYANTETKERTKEWKQYIKKYLHVRTADVKECSKLDLEDYFKNYVRDHSITNSERQYDPLVGVSENEYEKFMKQNKEGLYLALYEEVPLKTFLKEKGHIVLATPEGDALCFDYDYFRDQYKNKNEVWIYECTGRIIPGTNDRAMQFDITRPYIKICISKTGMNGYVPAAQVWSMLGSKRKVFFIKPHMVAQEQQMITHTIGHALATRHRSATALGANHCQHGSNILIFDICEYASKLKFPGSATSHSNSDTRSRMTSSSS